MNKKQLKFFFFFLRKIVNAIKFRLNAKFLRDLSGLNRFSKSADYER